jgi:uncharacterized protein with HEPN domain
MKAADAELTLRQIIEVCEKAIAFRNSVTWEEFRDDWRNRMLGERLVEVLGEAVKRFPMNCASDIRNCLGKKVCRHKGLYRLRL